MAASDHLGAQFTLYHGTAHPFSPGDMVEPGHTANWAKLSSSDRVSATTSRFDAHGYANTAQKNQQQVHGNPDAQGRVYRVEPVSQLRKGPTRDEYVSSGFRVMDEGESMMLPHQLDRLGIE